MELRKIPAAKLNPAAYNPRKDLQPNDPEYEKLLRSVEEFGYVEPVIWNERTGNIVGGHQRFKVLRHLGYAEIDCVVVDLDAQREKALNIALNKISGSWDMPKLSVLLEDIQASGIAPDLTGFTPPEIDEMFRKLQRDQGQIVEDDFDAKAEAETIEEPVTQPGDIWQIGRHRLICADSRNAAEIDRLMAGAKARMVFTDPPWNVDYGGSASPKYLDRKIANDNMSTEEFYDFMLAVFKNMASFSEPGCVVYCVMSAQEWGNLMLAMKESGYHWSSTIIWSKDKFVLSRKDYNTQYEPIWYGWLEGAARLVRVDDGKQSDVWNFERPTKSPLHPTTKPVALAAKAIMNSSHQGNIVLDLFGGSGTTMLACEQTQRVCYMSDCEPKFCDVICRRMAQHWDSDEDIFLLRNGEKIRWRDCH